MDIEEGHAYLSDLRSRESEIMATVRQAIRTVPGIGEPEVLTTCHDYSEPCVLGRDDTILAVKRYPEVVTEVRIRKNGFRIMMISSPSPYGAKWNVIVFDGIHHGRDFDDDAGMCEFVAAVLPTAEYVPDEVFVLSPEHSMDGRWRCP